jgi:hypothetical protein
MIDTRKTLTKLHNKFPAFTLDTLFEILDCITEEIFYTYNWQDKGKDTWRYDKNTNTVPSINYGNPTCAATANFEVPQKCD